MPLGAGLPPRVPPVILKKMPVTAAAGRTGTVAASSLGAGANAHSPGGSAQQAQQAYAISVVQATKLQAAATPAKSLANHNADGTIDLTDEDDTCRRNGPAAAAAAAAATVSPTATTTTTTTASTVGPPGMVALPPMRASYSVGAAGSAAARSAPATGRLPQRNSLPHGS